MVGIEINQYHIDHVQKKVKEAFQVQANKLQRGETIASDFQDRLREVSDKVGRLDARTRGLCEETVPHSTFNDMVARFEARLEALESRMTSSQESLTMDLQEAEQERVALGEQVESLEEKNTSLQNKVTLLSYSAFGILTFPC